MTIDEQLSEKRRLELLHAEQERRESERIAQEHAEREALRKKESEHEQNRWKEKLTVFIIHFTKEKYNLGPRRPSKGNVRKVRRSET